MEHNRLLKSAIIPFEEYESLMRDYVQKQKLQKRVDKAIEEIDYLISNSDISDYQGKKLKNILQGEDK